MFHPSVCLKTHTPARWWIFLLTSLIDAQAHLLRCYESLSESDGIFHVEETNSMMFQKHVFGLAVFHARAATSSVKFATRRPGAPPRVHDVDFLAGVKMLQHFFMPESVKARAELATSYNSRCVAQG